MRSVHLTVTRNGVQQNGYRNEAPLPPIHAGDCSAEVENGPGRLEHEVDELADDLKLGELLPLTADSSRDPQVVKNVYTKDSIWRNRDTFLQGHDEIVDFLTKKWAKEDGYRLRKELFAFTDNKVRQQV